MKDANDTWWGRWLQNRGRLTPAEGFVAVVFTVLLLAALLPAGRSLLYGGEARSTLANAKAARLAAQAVSAQCRGAGEAFGDQNGPYGLAEGIEEKILLLCKTPGDVYLLQSGEDGYEVAALIYREGDYTAWYSATDGSWEVFHTKELISTLRHP